MERQAIALDFINSQQWTFAKTMPKWPHEYVVRDAVNDKAFVEVVSYIRENGSPEPFYDKSYIFLQIGNYKYWTMGDPIEETIIINRCLLENTYLYKIQNKINF